MPPRRVSLNTRPTLSQLAGQALATAHAWDRWATNNAPSVVHRRHAERAAALFYQLADQFSIWATEPAPPGFTPPQQPTIPE